MAPSRLAEAFKWQARGGPAMITWMSVWAHRPPPGHAHLAMMTVLSSPDKGGVLGTLALAGIAPGVVCDSGMR